VPAASARLVAAMAPARMRPEAVISLLALGI
jgi:hypothetical protein